MDYINTFWINLSSFEKILWGIAIPFTIFFALQTLATIIGFSDDHDLDSEDLMSDSGLMSDVFTIRNAVSFFLGFSWGGIAFVKPDENILIPTIAGIVAGSFMILLNMALLKSFSLLQSSGSINLKEAIGKQGTVAIRIPPNKTQYGKVNVSVNGRVVNLEAYTDSSEAILEGSIVKIDQVIGSQLIVSKS